MNLKNITASIKFGDLSPWPVKLYSPGVMGPFAFIPFMGCYHGVIRWITPFQDIKAEGEGTSAGLEFVGDLGELLKGFKR